MNHRLLPLALISGLFAVSSIVPAQAPGGPAPSPGAKPGEKPMTMNDVFKKLGAQTSGTGQIGGRAEIQVPEGYDFLPAKGTQSVLRMMGNLTNGDEQGLIRNQKENWFVVFEFSDDGYVKDDDKDHLDAGAILKSIQEGEVHSNEARKNAGLPAQHTLGFAIPPHYNEQTNNLEWAIRFTTEGEKGATINHYTKLLGRRGVMEVTLVCDPEQLDAVLPDFRKLMGDYHYIQGETYADYRKGDKLATYGLIGAVAGGAALAASKAGLFSKLGVLIAKGGKAVILGIVAVFAAIAKFFKGLFGRKDSPYQS
jgi:uncharacterized membrane-anchored protein